MAVKTELYADPQFLKGIEQKNFLWIVREINMGQSQKVKEEIRHLYGLKVPHYPCFLIQNEDDSKPHLLVGSNSGTTLKKILRS